MRLWRPLACLGIALALASCRGGNAEGPVLIDIIDRDAGLAEPLRHADALAGQIVLGATAQGLVAFDAQGEVVTGLAESWIVADGGQSYIFRLRRMRWPDGEPVRAETVAGLLRQRMRASPDLLAGLRPEVRAMTDRVIEIRLDTALPAFIQLLAQPRLGLLGAGGGTGPFGGELRGGRLDLEPLQPEAAPNEEGEIEIRPIERRLLQTARGALALARFQAGKTDLVLGGRFEHLLLIPHARLGTTDVRADPAPGLFGLAIVGRSDFFTDRAVRDALSRAIDRARIAGDLNLQGWTTTTTPLPAALDMDGEPSQPAWAGMDQAERVATARSAVADWRARHGAAPVIRIALPPGAGASLLFHRLAADFRQLGLRIDRVGLTQNADLRLVDEVASFDSALWYLARLDCDAGLACDANASAFLDEARAAGSPAAQAAALAEAERLIVAHAGYIPLGLPIRWSLVDARLTGYAPSPRAIHPLNALFRATN